MATIQPLVLDELSGIWKFLVSIEWRDPCMVALITFHVVITSMVLLTRNHSNFQIILFFILLLLVYFSENINQLASNNWRLMATHQYFDSKGMFISMVFSIPILLNCMGMVVVFVKITVALKIAIVCKVERINLIADDCDVHCHCYLIENHLYKGFHSCDMQFVIFLPLCLLIPHRQRGVLKLQATWLYQSSQLMTKLKKAQLKQQAQLNAQGKQQAEACVPSHQHSKQD